MRPSGIGGQAVIEGVMMRNKNNYAVAVRTPNDSIEINKGTYVGINERIFLFRLPILRGVAAFIDSLILGMRTLMFSASFYEEEELDSDTSLRERRSKAAKEKKEKKDTIVMGMIMAISIIFAIAIFMLIPFGLAELFKGRIDSYIVRSIIEGVIRLAMFILYVKAITLMQDIKRVFMYHGAEHKVINCIERGLELNVSNAKMQTKEHKRCGTSFLLYVVLITMIVFLFIQTEALWLRIALRIVLIPVIAGVAYEFIRLAGRSKGKVMDILSRPGMWLQALTTKEPDDSMLEVAIASVEAVFDWRKYQGREKEQLKDTEETAAEVKKPVFETITLEDEDFYKEEIAEEASEEKEESIEDILRELESYTKNIKKSDE